MSAQHPISEHPVRMFFMLFIPVALLILGGAWYVGQERITDELDLVRSSEIGNVVQGVRRLDGELERPLRHLKKLAESNPLRSSPAKEAADSLANAFRTLIAYYPMYDKLRWIGADGMEQVRVNQVEGVGVRVAEAALENLSGRYYVSDALKLKPGEIYVSRLDLNIEHDKVDVPHRPMLRVAAPLHAPEGGVRGMLMLNVNAQRLLDAFTEAFGEAREHAMLVNTDGFWISSPTPSEAWGFMFGRKETLQTRHPEAWKAITAMPSGQVELADGMWTWSTIYPLKVEDSRGVVGVPAWLAISRLPVSRLLEIRSHTWSTVGTIALTLLALFGVLAAWLSRSLMERTRAMVEAAQAHVEAEAAQHMAEAKERFRLVVQANVNGLLVVDDAGRIVLVNPALERMFGYAPDELIDQPLEVLIPTDNHSQHVGERTAYMQAPVAKPMGEGRELHGRRKDGSIFPVEVSLSPFTEKGRQYVDAFVADLSARKH
ncbi:MAG: PAS domain S-box protein [Betaproteobacteria bacterium]|nr:PAS domain S-box protein [Betaproteobacteria bacterium]